MPTHTNIKQLQSELAGKNPRVILKSALSQFSNIAISFSGAEDVIIIDMAVQIKSDINVFTLDTGRLHPETYRFIERVRKHYKLTIDIQHPNNDALNILVREKGLFSFLEDGHTECCHIRKVEPLSHKVAALDAWITGQRKDQNSTTRQDLAEVEIDQTFSTVEHPVIKFNPLTNWSSKQVWDYIEAYDVPYNELHKRGFKSIGCEPCTRPTLPNQPEREGRWWWEDSAKKECGLHAGNLNL